MSSRDQALGRHGAYPGLRMMIAEQRVADLRRDAERKRRIRRSIVESAGRVGGSYRLPDGSWLHGHRDSS